MTENQRKNILYSVLLIAAMLLVWWIRDSKKNLSQWEKVELTGTTMGTTYQVKYLVSDYVNHQASIDSLLEDFNQCLSTYIPESEISRFNRGTLHRFERPYFYEMLAQSQLIYQSTEGAFDPTVMPLVLAWGFGPEAHETPDQVVVDSLKASVGFSNLFFDNYAVCKMMPGTRLDFSAIAKGYAVDLVVELLRSRKLDNVYVEIGGEVAASGVNDREKPWAVYIEKPLDSIRSVQAVVSLNNIAIATSGNYRNFYLKDGKKYAHTISPFTGYPIQHNLLGVSVFAGSCSTADAYATAFMVLGMEKAQEIVSAIEGLEAYFIYTGEQGQLLTKATAGAKDIILE